LGLPVTDSPILQRAESCRLLLEEAIVRAETRRYGQELSALVDEATERLDDLDAALLGLHPLRDVREFAVVAALRRMLDFVAASIPGRGRPRPPGARERELLARLRPRPSIRTSNAR
jgi:hypothetical protein